MCVCARVCISVPGPALETTVGEDVNSMLLLNLLSGTEYSVEVTASYPTGQSEPLLVNAKTCRYPYLMSNFYGWKQKTLSIIQTEL